MWSNVTLNVKNKTKQNKKYPSLNGLLKIKHILLHWTLRQTLRLKAVAEEHTVHCMLNQQSVRSTSFSVITTMP